MLINILNDKNSNAISALSNKLNYSNFGLDLRKKQQHLTQFRND